MNSQLTPSLKVITHDIAHLFEVHSEAADRDFPNRQWGINVDNVGPSFPEQRGIKEFNHAPERK